MQPDGQAKSLTQRLVPVSWACHVHHSVITEFDVPSYRTAAAHKDVGKATAQGRRAEKTKIRK